VNWGKLTSQPSYRMIDPVFINIDYAGARRGRAFVSLLGVPLGQCASCSLVGHRTRRIGQNPPENHPRTLRNPYEIGQLRVFFTSAAFPAGTIKGQKKRNYAGFGLIATRRPGSSSL